MALYTETFADYVEKSGYELPTAFDLIEGFEDLFLKYYCDKEIGFETENLFAIKLDLYAELYMEKYADRIEKLAVAYGLLDSPARTHYEENTTTLGAQRGTQTELPMNASTAIPNMVTTADQTENVVNVEITDNSITDKVILFDKLNEEVKIILEELLRRFENCFMRIY